MSAHSITSRGLAGRKIPQGTLTPMGTLLFSASEPGAWYDPSDMSTLFQDSAGTVPVTAVEQPVGRILDKSGRGNHATQATTTKRPVLSQRVNLLTKTEQFDDAVWVKGNSTISANAIVAPDGLSTADRLVENVGATGNKQVHVTVTFAAVTVYRMRVWVKPDSRTSVYIAAGSTNPWGATGSQRGVYVNCATGAVFRTEGGATATTQVGSDGWVFIDVTFPVTTTGGACYPLIRLCTEVGSFGYTGDGSGLYIWGASLTLATDAHLPYQRVNTATDYDADPAKFPAYLSFDGVDDAMQTGNIDFTGTDKMTVWAGVTKLSDAAAAILLEASTNTNANPGSFYITAPEGAGTSGLSFRSLGSLATSPVNLFGNAAPISRVVAALGDIGGDIATIRAGGASATSPQDQGTGNYGNYPLYIGARGGTSLYFTGRLYSLIVRGAQSSLSQIEATELYIKQKARLP